MKKINIPILVIFFTVMLFVIVPDDVYANHGKGGYKWTSATQELYCDPSLSNLNITSTVSQTPCQIIADAARDWTNVSNSKWTLTTSTSPAINIKAENLGNSATTGKMFPSQIFGIMYSAEIKINTQRNYGDSTVDVGVRDLVTTLKHEIGHLPTMYHNNHRGESNTSVMRHGSDILNAAQRTISSNDEQALRLKYP